MTRPLVSLVFVLTVAASVVIAGCGQAAPAPAPTQAPAAPTKAAEPTKAPAAAPTAAPAAPTAAPAKKVDFPQKGRVITTLVPYTAGGATDLVARLLGAELEKALGTQVQVVNKTGAGGQEAINELVKSRSDGHTIAAVALPTTLATYLDPERKATFARKDFQMLARIVAAPLNVAVKADGPYKTLKDLLDAAKANPEKVPFAAGTQLSGYHLGALHFEKVAGVKFAMVNFDGGAQGVTALLGGHVDASINQAGELLAQSKAGTVRLLGVLDSQASKFFPDVKTMESQGVKAYAGTNNVVVGPAGMPAEIVDTLGGEIKKITAMDEFNKKAADLGLEVRYLDAAQMATLWADLESQVDPLIQQIRKK